MPKEPIIDHGAECRKLGKKSLEEALANGKNHNIVKCKCGGHSWAILEIPFDPKDEERDDRTMFVCLACNSYRVAEVQTGQVIGAPYFLDKYSRERQKAFKRADTTKEGEERKENWFIYPSKRGEELFWTIHHGYHDEKKKGYIEHDDIVTQERVQWLWSKVIRHLPKESNTDEAVEKIRKVLGIASWCSQQAFYGGKNRAIYYFPYWDQPIKVLVYLGYVEKKKGSKKFKRIMNIEDVVINPAHEIYNADKKQSTLEGF